MSSVPDVYNPVYDLSSLSHEQRSGFVQHQFTYTFSIDALILLHFATLGLFTLIYFGLMHSQLPMIKHDDFKARKAIGFMLIPLFNLYWQFRFWRRLVDRLELQLRFRKLPPTISGGLMLATIIVSLIPVAGLAALLVMYLSRGLILETIIVGIIAIATLVVLLVILAIYIVRIQRACNEILLVESGNYKILLEKL
jgi:hypothetical protein